VLNFKELRFPSNVILICIRWYAAYTSSLRCIEEMMEECGISVDHSSTNWRVVRVLALIKKMARKHKRLIGRSWRMDEMSIKIKGVWTYLYRAVDKPGRTVDFLLASNAMSPPQSAFFPRP